MTPSEQQRHDRFIRLYVATEEALRGFVRCSDGRLYHRVLAEKARTAWDERLRYEHRKAADRHRKAMKEKDTTEQDFHGDTAPMSAEALNKVGTAYKVYTAVYPALRAWTMLDHLIPFTRGYMYPATSTAPSTAKAPAKAAATTP